MYILFYIAFFLFFLETAHLTVKFLVTDHTVQFRCKYTRFPLVYTKMNLQKSYRYCQKHPKKEETGGKFQMQCSLQKTRPLH